MQQPDGGALWTVIRELPAHGWRKLLCNTAPCRCFYASNKGPNRILNCFGRKGRNNKPHKWRFAATLLKSLWRCDGNLKGVSASFVQYADIDSKPLEFVGWMSRLPGRPQQDGVRLNGFYFGVHRTSWSVVAQHVQREFYVGSKRIPRRFFPATDRANIIGAGRWFIERFVATPGTRIVFMRSYRSLLDV